MSKSNAEDRELIVRHLISVMHAIETKDGDLWEQASDCLEIYAEDEPETYKSMIGLLEDLAVAQLSEES